MALPRLYSTLGHLEDSYPWLCHNCVPPWGTWKIVTHGFARSASHIGARGEQLPTAVVVASSPSASIGVCCELGSWVLCLVPVAVW